jgi:uncharacterized protein YhjY with autotransporter beta-barrel domain
MNMRIVYIARHFLLALLIISPAAWSQFSRLVDNFDTELERESARAALRTYQRLISESGCLDSLISDPGPSEEGPSCTGRNFRIFANIREIIHTGNDITGIGPSEFSLRSDIEGLGFALRWLAAEEYAAQGDLSSDFTNGQVNGLSTRLSALRFGARGFQFASNGVWQPENSELANIYGTNGGAAGDSSNYSRWGGFANLQFGTGSRDPTGLEDAFDFDMANLTFGFDYRVDDKWIIGLVGGISQQEIEFDSSQSIVNGGIDADGYSIMPFFMYQPGNFYLSGSLGLQQMRFDSLRSIRYPSFNPSVPSTNTDTVSETDAQITTLFLEAGYNWSVRKFSFEPFININASAIAIDEFVEDDLNDRGFDLVIKEQDFDLLDVVVGLKSQYVFTPKFGVFIPYITIEQFNQINDESRDIEAYYAQQSTDESIFFIPTEELDGNYQTYTVGISSVLRGGREKTPGGSVGGDIQAYANFRTISGLTGYTFDMYTLGFRYTF